MKEGGRNSRAGKKSRLISQPRANKFGSWASKNGSFVVQWASEISLSNLVSNN